MSIVGDILSTVGGYLGYRGGYHDTCIMISPHGTE